MGWEDLGGGWGWLLTLRSTTDLPTHASSLASWEVGRWGEGGGRPYVPHGLVRTPYWFNGLGLELVRVRVFVLGGIQTWGTTDLMEHRRAPERGRPVCSVLPFVSRTLGPAVEGGGKQLYFNAPSTTQDEPHILILPYQFKTQCR